MHHTYEDIRRNELDQGLNADPMIPAYDDIYERLARDLDPSRIETDHGR